ncbi:MAG: GNAT family N-acetyltransferase [Candidatus Bathyarchaeia archaeon]
MCVLTREARIEDLEVLYKIELECFNREAFTRRQLAYFLASPDFVKLVAEVDGDVVGFVIGSVQHYNNRGIGHILSLDVSKGYRRRRIGSTLLSELERVLVEVGVEVCYLEVRADNVAALRLYRKRGFVPVETLKDYYGVGVHGLRLKKDLRR